MTNKQIEIINTINKLLNTGSIYSNKNYRKVINEEFNILDMKDSEWSEIEDTVIELIEQIRKLSKDND